MAAILGPGGPSMAAILGPGGPSTCSNIFCRRWSGGTYFGGTICGMTDPTLGSVFRE